MPRFVVMTDRRYSGVMRGLELSVTLHLAWPGLTMLHMLTAQVRRYLPLLLIVIIFPFFFTGGPSPDTSRLVGALWDCGHILFFCLLVLAIDSKIPLRGPYAAVILTVIVFLAGGLIELIQSYVGRDGNLLDVYYDLTGTWIGLIWCQPPTRTMRRARIAVFVLVLPAVTKIIFLALLQFQAARDFPLIADFETALELYQYRGTIERSPLVQTRGNFSLKLTLQTTRYSGINFSRRYPDWTPYNALKVDIYNPDSTPLDIVIRVNDIAHDLAGWNDNDRYNHWVRLHQGWNYLSLPIEDIVKGPARRRMDMQKVSAIGLYTAGLTTTRDIYIDNIRLQK
jgi:VanZ family protein